MWTRWLRQVLGRPTGSAGLEAPWPAAASTDASVARSAGAPSPGSWPECAEASPGPPASMSPWSASDSCFSRWEAASACSSTPWPGSFSPSEGETTTIFSRAITDRRGIRLVIAIIPALVLVQIVAAPLHIGYLGSFSWPVFLAAGGPSSSGGTRARTSGCGSTTISFPCSDTGAERQSRWRSDCGSLIGAVLGVGGLLVLIRGHPTGAALRPVGGALLVIAAIVVVFGPWWLSLVRDLMSERQARAMAEERAQMAAHVHDSVLQTLALIQRSADDPQHVVRLARAQERELRSWLFEGRPPGTIGEEAATLADGHRRAPAPGRSRPRHHRPGRGGRRLPADRRAAGATRRVAGGHRQCGQMVGGPAGVRLCRGRAGRRHAVRPRSWPGLRSRRRARGPPGHRPVDPGPDGSLRGIHGHPFFLRAREPRSSCQCPGASRSVSEAGRPRIFLVDDHAMFRVGVRAELGTAVEVVGEADEVEAAIELINERVPDVVLLDVHLPGGGGQAVLRGVTATPPRGAVPGPVGVRCSRGRDRGHPCRGPGLRDQDHLG